MLSYKQKPHKKQLITIKFDPCFPTDVEFKLADVEAS